MTIEQLGQKTKLKYPIYSDIPDKELGEMILQKYPVYQDKITQKTEEKIIPQEKTFQEGERGMPGVAIGAGKGVISTLTGTAGLGEKMLGSVWKTILPKSLEQKIGITEKTPTLGLIKKPVEPVKTSAEQLVPEELRTPVGTAEKIGFGAEQIGEFFIPGGAGLKAGKAIKMTKALKDTQKTAKFLGGLTRMGTEAGIVTGQTSLQRGEMGKEELMAGGMAGVVTAALGGIGKLAQRTVPTLWKSILGRTAKETAKSPKLEQAIVEKTKLFGTKKGILKQAQSKIQEAEIELDDLLSAKTGHIDIKNVASKLDDLEKSYVSVPGESGSINIIQEMRKELLRKGMLSVEGANQLKRDIYKMISNSYGKGMLEVPVKRETQKLIARGLKEEIERIVPEAKNINERQAIYLQVAKAMERQINKPILGIGKTGIGLYDIAVGGAGFIGGGGLGTVGAVAGSRFVGSAIFKSGIAKLLNYFNTLSPTKKILFYNALKGLSSEVSQRFTPKSQK